MQVIRCNSCRDGFPKKGITTVRQTEFQSEVAKIENFGSHTLAVPTILAVYAYVVLVTTLEWNSKCSVAWIHWHGRTIKSSGCKGKGSGNESFGAIVINDRSRNAEWNHFLSFFR